MLAILEALPEIVVTCDNKFDTELFNDETPLILLFNVSATFNHVPPVYVVPKIETDDILNTFKSPLASTIFFFTE